MGLEKTLKSSLDCKEIKSVHPKGNQFWTFIGRIDTEAETPILWPPDAKSWLMRKDPDAGKDWRQEKKGKTEDEMVGRHHWLYGHEFEQALGDGEGQGGLACYSPWGRKESDTVEWLTNNNSKTVFISKNELVHCLIFKGFCQSYNTVLILCRYLQVCYLELFYSGSSNLRGNQTLSEGVLLKYPSTHYKRLSTSATLFVLCI